MLNLLGVTSPALAGWGTAFSLSLAALPFPFVCCQLWLPWSGSTHGPAVGWRPVWTASTLQLNNIVCFPQGRVCEAPGQAPSPGVLRVQRLWDKPQAQRTLLCGRLHLLREACPGAGDSPWGLWSGHRLPKVNDCINNTFFPLSTAVSQKTTPPLLSEFSLQWGILGMAFYFAATLILHLLAIAATNCSTFTFFFLEEEKAEELIGILFFTIRSFSFHCPLQTEIGSQSQITDVLCLSSLPSVHFQ